LAEVTTLREREPQTAAGFPWREGSSLSSTEIKKASISMWRIMRSSIIQKGPRGLGSKGSREKN
jgi:hypothetical protein